MAMPIPNKTKCCENSPMHKKEDDKWCLVCRGITNEMTEVSYKQMLRLIEHVANKNGSVSGDYVNNSSLFTFKCDIQTHEAWTIAYKIIFPTLNRASWCKECAGKGKRTEEQYDEVARKNNWIFITRGAHKAGVDVEWGCVQNPEHKFRLSYTYIKMANVKKCPECRPKKYTLEMAQKAAATHIATNGKPGECLRIQMNEKYRTEGHWKCGAGHEWDTEVTSVIKGRHWCRECAGTALKTIEDAQNLAKKNGGQCKSTEYVNDRAKLQWICQNNHEFKKTYADVRSGGWCKYCSQSRGERVIKEYLVTNNISFEEQKGFPTLGKFAAGGRGLKFDFFLVDYNLAIEFDGEQHEKPSKWFGEGHFINQIQNDEDKHQWCVTNSVSFLKIRQTSLDNNRVHIVIAEFLERLASLDETTTFIIEDKFRETRIKLIEEYRAAGKITIEAKHNSNPRMVVAEGYGQILWYQSISEAAKVHNLVRANLSEHLNSNCTKEKGGYKWRFVEEGEIPPSESTPEPAYINSTVKKIITPKPAYVNDKPKRQPNRPVFRIIDGTRTKYDTLKEAEKETGIPHTTITSAIERGIATIDGSKWEDVTRTKPESNKPIVKRSSASTPIIRTTNGEETYYASISDVVNALGVARDTFKKHINGPNNTELKWGSYWRYSESLVPLPHQQIGTGINNTISNKPPHPGAKRVSCIIDGKEERYSCLAEAARVTGLSLGIIKHSIKKQVATKDARRWRYA